MLSLFHNEGAEVNTYIKANGVNEAAVGAWSCRKHFEGCSTLFQLVFGRTFSCNPNPSCSPFAHPFFIFFYRRSSSFLIGDLLTGHVPTGTPVMAMSLSQGSCPERLLSNGQAGSAVKWRCGRQHSVWQTVWHIKLIETVRSVSQLWGFVKGIGAAKLLQAPLILQQLW